MDCAPYAVAPSNNGKYLLANACLMCMRIVFRQSLGNVDLRVGLEARDGAVRTIPNLVLVLPLACLGENQKAILHACRHDFIFFFFIIDPSNFQSPSDKQDSLKQL